MNMGSGSFYRMMDYRVVNMMGCGFQCVCCYECMCKRGMKAKSSDFYSFISTLIFIRSG